MMEGLELISFQIISSVGTARSYYIEAIQKAKAGKIDEAKKTIKEGEEIFLEGHHSHAELLQKVASGEDVKINLLLMHAEDQMMSAESFGILAQEFIDLYEKINL